MDSTSSIINKRMLLCYFVVHIGLFVGFTPRQIVFLFVAALDDGLLKILCNYSTIIFLIYFAPVWLYFHERARRPGFEFGPTFRRILRAYLEAWQLQWRIVDRPYGAQIYVDWKIILLR
jgi:hypothetical protein